MLTTHEVNESDEVYALKERIRFLEKALGSEWRAPAILGLTPSQERVLAVIVAKRGHATVDTIFDVIYGEHEDPPDETVVRVLVNYVRRKLKPHGITIKTRWNVGYLITPDNLARLNALYGDAERPNHEAA